MSQVLQGISSRRSIMLAGAAATAGVTLGAGAALAQTPVADPFVPVPIPDFPTTKESQIQLPSGKVFVRDTGGSGPAIVLMHPATGSALIWAYQMPVLAAAGYRVIAWSRRGHYGSDPVDKGDPGSYARDLDDLANALGLSQFNIVASAAGCTISMDYAMAFASRVRKLVISAASLGNIAEPDFIKATQGSRIKGFDDLPADFRELSPSYRSANPEGAKAWVELEHKALTGNRQGPKLLNAFNWSTLSRMKTPTLLLYGGADLAAPPTLGRMVARHLPNRELVVVPEAGHSIYWEQPETFNRTVLDFLSKA